jgi:hypothetical protein
LSNTPGQPFSRHVQNGGLCMKGLRVEAVEVIIIKEQREAALVV